MNIKKQFENLVLELVTLPDETEWVEFKLNNNNPDMIGEYISALSNSAALIGKTCAYILWGIKNKTHEIIGTTFQPRRKKIGNEELENWLLTHLEPRIDVKIHENTVNDKPIVLFEIQSATNKPVGFKGVEYIRIGSYKKKLKEYPEKERALWRLFESNPFEKDIALDSVSADDVLSLLDYTTYFRMMKLPPPANQKVILQRFIAEKVIMPITSNKYNISNLGAILLAFNLNKFERLTRKALRVIIYKGNNRIETIKEQTGVRGYAIGFIGAIDYVKDQLPQNEQIKETLREKVRIYPTIAIRELVANALIHQDFNITGTGPMVEIFTDRMEITNPGAPLIDPSRFIDEPPRSRNETLSAFMRRMNICEERGSGIDKVISNVEVFQLPAPDFRIAGSNTVAVLYAPRSFSEMDREERIRACYQHACLLYVSGKRMTNASLRKRLGIKDSNYPQVSRIIRDSTEDNKIKPYSKDASYVPFWA